MSLNARVGFVLLSVAALLPVWLPLAPFAWWWITRERRAGRDLGLIVLPRFVAHSVMAYAEATLPVPPRGGWRDVAERTDSYLAAVQSPRHWRSLMMLFVLEFAPCLRGRRRLSRMPLAARREWIQRHLSTTRGLMAVPALARQLVRMAYYSDPSIAAGLGFRTMRERRPNAVAGGNDIGQGASGRAAG
jgi:hypothetical protein